MVILALAAVAVAQEGTCVADDETCLLQTSVKHTTRSKGISRHAPHLSSRVFETLGKATAGKPDVLQQALQALMSVPIMNKEAHKDMVRHHPVLKALVQQFPFIKEAIGQIEDPGLLHEFHVYMQSGSKPSTSSPTGMKKDKKKWSKNSALLSNFHKRLKPSKGAIWYEGWGCGMNISWYHDSERNEVPLFPEPCYGYPSVNGMQFQDPGVYAIMSNYSQNNGTWTNKYEIVAFYEDAHMEDRYDMIALADLGSQWPNSFVAAGEIYGTPQFFYSTSVWGYDQNTQTSSRESWLLHASDQVVVNVSGADFTACSPGAMTGSCQEDDGMCSLFVSCQPANWPGNYTIDLIEVNLATMTVTGQKSILTSENLPNSPKLVGDKLFWTTSIWDKNTSTTTSKVYSMAQGTDPKEVFTLPPKYYSMMTDGADLVTGKYDKWDSVTKMTVYNLRAYMKTGDNWTLADEWSTDGFTPGDIIAVPDEPEPPPPDEAPVVLPPGTYKVE